MVITLEERYYGLFAGFPPLGHTVLPGVSAIHTSKPWQGTEITTRSRCSSTAESGWAPRIRGGPWKEISQRKKENTLRKIISNLL